MTKLSPHFCSWSQGHNWYSPASSSPLHSKFPSLSAPTHAGPGGFYNENNFLLNINFSGQARCRFLFVWAEYQETLTYSSLSVICARTPSFSCCSGLVTSDKMVIPLACGPWKQRSQSTQRAAVARFNEPPAVSPGESMPLLGTRASHPAEPRVVGTGLYRTPQ